MSQVRSFMTADRMAALPSMTGLDPEQRQAAASDSVVLLQRIQVMQVECPDFITEDAVRSWGEQNGWDPDRMSRALGVLLDTNQIMAFERTSTETPPPTEAPPDEPPPVEVPPPEEPPVEEPPPAEEPPAEEPPVGEEPPPDTEQET